MRLVKLVVAILFGVASAASIYRPWNPNSWVIPFAFWAVASYALMSGIQALWRTTKGGRRIGYVARGLWRRGRSRASQALSDLERDGK